MIGLVGIIALVTVLGLSLVLNKVTTIALSMTGLSWESAKFQARSALTGTGFTTSEAEKIVNHPVRRRIIMWVMLMRNAGLMSIIISLIFTFGTTGEDVDKIYRLLWLIGAIFTLWLLTKSSFLNKYLNKLISIALKKWTDLDTRDYAGLLKLAGDYSVMEIQIKKDDWLIGKKLKDCNLKEEGINILGIYRDNKDYIGVPKGDTEIYENDTLILYGRSQALKKLDERRSGIAGDQAHKDAVEEQKQNMAEQEVKEKQHRKEKTMKGKN